MRKKEKKRETKKNKIIIRRQIQKKIKTKQTRMNKIQNKTQKKITRIRTKRKK